MRLPLLPISSPFPLVGQVLLSSFHLQGFPWWALHILECHWSHALLDALWSECLIQSPWTSRQGDSLECSSPAAQSSVSRVGGSVSHQEMIQVENSQHSCSRTSSVGVKSFIYGQHIPYCPHGAEEQLRNPKSCSSNISSYPSHPSSPLNPALSLYPSGVS